MTDLCPYCAQELHGYGLRLLKAREKRELSQRALGRVLDRLLGWKSGRGATLVYKLEAGRALHPSHATKVGAAIAAALDAPGLSTPPASRVGRAHFGPAPPVALPELRAAVEEAGGMRALGRILVAELGGTVDQWKSAAGRLLAGRPAGERGKALLGWLDGGEETARPSGVVERVQGEERREERRRDPRSALDALLALHAGRPDAAEVHPFGPPQEAALRIAPGISPQLTGGGSPTERAGALSGSRPTGEGAPLGHPRKTRVGREAPEAGRALSWVARHPDTEDDARSCRLSRNERANQEVSHGNA